MMLRTRSIVSLGLLLGSFLAAWAQDQWVEVRSAHFNVLTDSGESRGRDLALQLEQMRFLFAQTFFKDQVDQAIPLQVIGLRGEKQISEYAPLFQGKPVSVAGFYLRTQDKDYIVLDSETRQRSEALFHEYAHLLLDNNLPDAPAWFSEGFAQFCSTIQIGGKDIIVGHAPEQAAKMARTQRLLPLSVLLNVDHNSPMYNDDHSSRSLFYAQSWLAVHYFWTTHKMEAVHKYLQLTRHHTPVADAVQQAFGMSMEKLGEALDEYSRAAMIASRISLPEHLAQPSFSATPMMTADAAATLADLHAHQDDYRSRSVEEFKELLARDPDNAIAQRGIGYALYKEHHTESALPYLRHEAQRDLRDPKDWLVHYYLSSALAQEQNDSLAPEIEKESRMVTRLNPDFADGHGLLGFAFFSQHKIAEAAIEYETALRLRPESEVYALNLAEAYTRQGRHSQARLLFDHLQNSQNWYISTAARSHLEEQHSAVSNQPK
ncbi:MAG: hypothetical protein DMG65_07715 [Candidatus Angelobacter sp. Gp1-AA117]|nr:MAG: hypothetical protein DMG65_07715 [Candidatus Angelobacter sp. Gp1-AA117]